MQVKALGDIARLLNAFKECFPSICTNQTRRHEIAYKLFSHGTVLAAMIGDKHVGFAAFYANNHETSVAFLSLLAVSPMHRGYGIGRFLLAEVEARSGSSGMKFLRLEVRSDNNGAISFYKHLGFSTESIPDLSSINMIKTISNLALTE